MGDIPILDMVICNQIMNDIIHSPMFYLLLGLVMLDFLTGMGKAIITKRYSSRTGLNGLIKHSLIILFVVFMKFFGRLFGLSSAVLVMTGLFSFNYFVSIIENLELMGVEIPDFITDKLIQMKDDMNNSYRIKPDDEVIIKRYEEKKGVDR